MNIFSHLTTYNKADSNCLTTEDFDLFVTNLISSESEYRPVTIFCSGYAYDMIQIRFIWPDICVIPF